VPAPGESDGSAVAAGGGERLPHRVEGRRANDPCHPRGVEPGVDVVDIDARIGAGGVVVVVQICCRNANN
jgi:hypothetical protein